MASDSTLGGIEVELETLNNMTLEQVLEMVKQRKNRL